MKYDDFSLLYKISQDEVINELYEKLPSAFDKFPEYIDSITLYSGSCGSEHYFHSDVICHNEDNLFHSNLKDQAISFLYLVEEYFGSRLISSIIGEGYITFFRDGTKFKVDW
jgi:hypothetical protein